MLYPFRVSRYGLFNFYMDELSVRLCMSGLGARPAGKVMNHLGYADYLSLLTMSSKGMQTLLQICEDYATVHDLVYLKVSDTCR